MRIAKLTTDRLVLLGLCASLALAYPLALRAADATPQMTKDGLVLKSRTDHRVVWVKPGADFSKYNKVIVVNPLVEFQKDWQQNYNNTVDDPSLYVTNDKVQQMKSWLASEFTKVFTKELQKGGYQVVNTPGPGVLSLRPAIVNVQVTAPDIMAAGFNMNVITSAGSGVFYLELWDTATNTILARAMDAEADQQPFARQANSVTNAQAADIILQGWADALVSHLDAVRGKSGST
jgi:Protein of unknown function (DUF3313)